MLCFIGLPSDVGAIIGCALTCVTL